MPAECGALLLRKFYSRARLCLIWAVRTLKQGGSRVKDAAATSALLWRVSALRASPRQSWAITMTIWLCRVSVCQPPPAHSSSQRRSCEGLEEKPGWVADGPSNNITNRILKTAHRLLQLLHCWEAIQGSKLSDKYLLGHKLIMMIIWKHQWNTKKYI